MGHCSAELELSYAASVPSISVIWKYIKGN